MRCYRVKMLPTGHAVYVDASFSQDGISPARGVFLSRYSRARCNVPSKVLEIAHATMTKSTFWVLSVTLVPSNFGRPERKSLSCPCGDPLWTTPNAMRLGVALRLHNCPEQKEEACQGQTRLGNGGQRENDV